MAKKAKRPRLLNEVLQAIADAREAQGCTVKKILKHVEESIVKKKIKPKLRNIVMQVHKAVDHGVVKGLLKKQYGKVYLILGKKKPFASKPTVNKRKKTFYERLRKGGEDRRRNPAPKNKKKKPSINVARKHSRDDTDTSSLNYSSYYPSSRSCTGVSSDLDSYSDRRRSRRIQNKKHSHKLRKAGGKLTVDNPRCSHGSSPNSRRTSKNCIEIPRDDEGNNANPTDEANCCGNPECLCNPNRM